MQKPIIVAFGTVLLMVSACSKAPQANHSTAVNLSQATSQLNFAADPPEPPGGCEAKVTTGACGSEGTGAPKCVSSADQCTKDETYIVDYPSCHYNHACTIEARRPVQEGDVKAVFWQQPQKGGNATDVSSANPACDATSNGAGRCHWECIDASAGRIFDLTTVSFAAKEADGDYNWSPSDPLGHNWKKCSQGSDCDIGWAKWEAFDISDTHVCARFKNWSHDRVRYAKIQATQKP